MSWVAAAKKASSEALNCTMSRITSGETITSVMGIALTDLLQTDMGTDRPALSSRDLENPTARAAFELGRQKGFAKGVQQGHEQGYIEGSRAFEDFRSREIADAAQHLNRLVSAFREELTSFESQLASDLVSLAIDIARQVLRDELQRRPDALIPAAREALRALGEGASRLEFHVNPVDAAALREHLQAQAPQAGWHLTPDPAISVGGCRLEADTGVADATFETRWQAVMASLGRDEEPLP